MPRHSRCDPRSFSMLINRLHTACHFIARRLVKHKGCRHSTCWRPEFCRIFIKNVSRTCAPKHTPANRSLLSYDNHLRQGQYIFTYTGFFYVLGSFNLWYGSEDELNTTLCVVRCWYSKKEANFGGFLFGWLLLFSLLLILLRIFNRKFTELASFSFFRFKDGTLTRGLSWKILNIWGIRSWERLKVNVKKWLFSLVFLSADFPGNIENEESKTENYRERILWREDGGADLSHLIVETKIRVTAKIKRSRRYLREFCYI